MFVLYAQKGKLTTRRSETLISGSAYTYSVQFKFSDDWNGLVKTAVFKTPDGTMTKLLKPDGLTTIPWEVLKKFGVNLLCGVYGTKNGTQVLPTVWVNLGLIQEGTSTPDNPDLPPTPDAWDELVKLVESKGDSLSLDGNELILKSGDKELDRVTLPSSTNGAIGSDEVTRVRVLTPEQFDALEEYDDHTLYLIGDVPEGAELPSQETVDSVITSSDIKHIRVIDKEEYEQLAERDASTLYLIRG